MEKHFERLHNAYVDGARLIDIGGLKLLLSLLDFVNDDRSHRCDLRLKLLLEGRIKFQFSQTQGLIKYGCSPCRIFYCSAMLPQNSHLSEWRR